MKERVDIWIDESVLLDNDTKQRRLEAAYHLEQADRTPVMVESTFWNTLAARGIPFSQFISSPRQHLREQILNYKWRVENIRDDQPIETSTLTFQPDFGSLRGTEFPMEIEWQEDQPAKTSHLLKEAEAMDSVRIPEPDGGLNALKINYFHGMQDALDDFDVRLNGQRLPVKITISQPGGPIPSAFALCGSNLFLWMKTDPDRVHHLMEIVTESHRRCVRFFDELSGTRPDHPLWLGADSAEMMSPVMFREFVVPYYNRLWEQYPLPRIFHMCGRINHLLDVIRDDLHINQHDGFGFPVDRKLLAEKWAGRIVMRGGPHPLLIHDGPVDTIVEECKSYIHTAGSKGGYILSEGFNLMPGTPPEHIAAMIRAAIEA
jgi:uroporphyrinogen-III decarboxylase